MIVKWMLAYDERMTQYGEMIVKLCGKKYGHSWNRVFGRCWFWVLRLETAPVDVLLLQTRCRS
jgi:hypothetical protein